MTQFLAITTISLLGAMSPGPDFFIVMKYAGLYHRKHGLMATIGIATALLIHQAYCILGLNWLLTQSPALFRMIKVVGAAYLLYLGFSALRFKATSEFIANENKVASSYPALATSFKQGFLCNALNPKAALFFIGLYSLIIDPATSLGVKVLYGLDIFFVTLCWFSFVTLMINLPKIKQTFITYQAFFVCLFGVVIMAFGTKVLFLSL